MFRLVAFVAASLLVAICARAIPATQRTATVPFIGASTGASVSASPSLAGDDEVLVLKNTRSRGRGSTPRGRSLRPSWTPSARRARVQLDRPASRRARFAARTRASARARRAAGAAVFSPEPPAPPPLRSISSRPRRPRRGRRDHLP